MQEHVQTLGTPGGLSLKGEPMVFAGYVTLNNAEQPRTANQKNNLQEQR